MPSKEESCGLCQLDWRWRSSSQSKTWPNSSDHSSRYTSLLKKIKSFFNTVCPVKIRQWRNFLKKWRVTKFGPNFINLSLWRKKFRLRRKFGDWSSGFGRRSAPPKTPAPKISQSPWRNHPKTVKKSSKYTLWRNLSLRRNDEIFCIMTNFNRTDSKRNAYPCRNA